MCPTGLFFNMFLRSIFLGNKYPKLSVSEKGKILNVAAQVGDESHGSLVVIYWREKNTEIYDHTSKQYLKLKKNGH